MKNANSNLSMAATAVLRGIRGICEDIRMDDSGECAGLITRHHEVIIRSKLAELGFTPDSFDRAIKERTSERWAYFSGLLIGDMMELEHQ